MFESVAQIDLSKGVNSLGSRFAAAREARGIPLEQAAHETRIRVQRLQEIENDDLSHFSHPSYARMFLTDYARYLGIAHSEVCDSLPSPGAASTEGYQYLQGFPEARPFRPLARETKPRRKGTVIFGSVAVVLCAFFALEIAITLRKLDRVNRVSLQDSALLTQEIGSLSVAASAPTDVAPSASETEIDDSLDASTEPVDLSLIENVEASTAPIVEVSVNEPPAVSPLFVGGTVDHGGPVR